MFYPKISFMKLQKVPWNKVLRPATCSNLIKLSSFMKQSFFVKSGLNRHKNLESCIFMKDPGNATTK